MASTAGARTGEGLRAGTPVEVRERFARRWVGGFDVAMVVDGGYLLRRRSDDSVLPATFTRDDVRPAAGLEAARR